MRFLNFISRLPHPVSVLACAPRGVGPLLQGEGEYRVVPRKLLKYSRKLRKRQTPHEAILWAYLRSRRLGGLKFRRQYPIARFIVDFCCFEKRIIVELDGRQHGEKKHAERDRIRDEILKSKGYKILRVWNSEINNNLEGVAERIIQLAGEK
jgi:very-short-patch-repair endonuclease